LFLNSQKRNFQKRKRKYFACLHELLFSFVCLKKNPFLMCFDEVMKKLQKNKNKEKKEMFKLSTDKKSWQAKLINRNKIINNINF
jgi:hypothetical protein